MLRMFMPHCQITKDAKAGKSRQSWHQQFFAIDQVTHMQ